jgi:hypothetical protein
MVGKDACQAEFRSLCVQADAAGGERQQWRGNACFDHPGPLLLSYLEHDTRKIVKSCIGQRNSEINQGP